MKKNKYYNDHRYFSINNLKYLIINPLHYTCVYLSILTFSGALFFINNSSHGATINVPVEFETIQEAIDVADAGDTVVVDAGTYFEQVTMKNGVSLQGASQNVTTILVNTGDFALKTADNVTISELTITNNISDGILIDKTSPFIKNCTIKDCEGDGIQVNNSVAAPIVVRCTIKDNKDDGINLSEVGPAIIINNIIETNSGRGIMIRSSDSILIANNNINTNFSGGIGYGGSGNIGGEIKNNIIWRVGDSKNGTGIDTRTDAVNSAAPSIVNNTINGYSTGILMRSDEDSRPIITNNNITFNRTGLSSGFPINTFNNVFGNDEDYKDTIVGINDISVDPLYKDPENGDFRLKPDSPVIDAGDPSKLDFDGTRSDMGVFGGPGSEGTGPVVFHIAVSPNIVKQGDPLTISAKSSVAE